MTYTVTSRRVRVYKKPSTCAWCGKQYRHIVLVDGERNEAGANNTKIVRALSLPLCLPCSSGLRSGSPVVWRG